MTSVTTSSFRDYALRTAAVASRVETHAASEESPDVAVTLATVTPPDELSWMDCYAWAAPAPRADGSLQMSLSTDWDHIAGFYTAGKDAFQLKHYGTPLTRISTDWYGLFESRAELDLASSGPLEQEWVLFAPLDGDSGITGEVAWGRFAHRVPGPELTDEDRAKGYERYLAALRSADVDAIVTTVTPDVVGATRDLTGLSSPSFVPFDGAEELAALHRQFLRRFEVESVEPVTLLIRGWYLFGEQVWTVVSRETADRLCFVSAEIHVLDVDGRAWARAGFSTPLEPA
jgi:hypothetical protein